MSHHRKRVYPSAQMQGYASNGFQQPALVNDGAGAYGAPMGYPAPGQVPMAAGAPPVVGAGIPAAQPQLFTPVQQQLNQQIDQTTAAMGNVQLHNVPVVDPNSYYQAPAPGMASPYMPVAGAGVPVAPAGMTGAATGGVPIRGGKPMNQLYPIDLLTELPPPIHDLSLPPPPLMVPPERMLVPSEWSNAPSEYIRCTLNAIPKNNSLLKKSKLPFALVIRPYQHLQDHVNPPPLNEDGVVVRCRRCRAYMSPFVAFIDQGRRWRCCFCRLANDVPMQFDQTMAGVPANRYDRNEVKYAVMEYLAPKEYTMRQPPPSTYSFILDVSQNAIKSGLLATATRTIAEMLDSIPNHDSRTRISILCVDNNIHYFSIPPDEDSDQVRMMDVADLDEPFFPRPNSMVVPLKSCRNNLERVLNLIPEVFQFNIMSKFALGPALKSAYNLIGGIGGKIIVVSSTLPNIGVGKLQKRNESGSVNTSKESAQLLSCQDTFYKSFTIDCSKVQITVDTFLASEDYMDVATLANLGRYTGGQTHFYPGFSATKLTDVTKFTKEFSKHLSMDISLETVMRARGTTGIRSNTFYGHFFNRSSDLCAFSTMPRDQSYVFDMSIDDSIIGDYACIQIGTLLSLNTGQRRIRVITMCIPTTESLSDVYASVDQLALTAYHTEKAVEKALASSLQDAREYLNKAVQDVLAVYKKEIVVSNTAGGAPLRLCANMRMFPLLMHSLSQHMAFRPGIVPSDHRAAALNNLESMPLKYLVKNIYATVYSLHDMSDDVGFPDENGELILPEPINASASLFERYGLYLIDNGSELFLWIGGDAVNELVMDVFGTQDIFQVPIGKQELPIVEGSEFNERVRNIIAKVREHDDVISFQSLYIVRGASLSEPVNHISAREVATLRLWATSALVEDKILNSESYREFLQNMKMRISK
ncbi:COPII subunit [Zygosaccharomyces mellis]|uniref:COPII subunit n=1 Tax=Zygosaccharomyces mellis TaxID=42258 RepID=A0A4C2E028_9SACH|nr:COPII subunit [Zygosaccharomyces mellis]